MPLQLYNLCSAPLTRLQGRTIAVTRYPCVPLPIFFTARRSLTPYTLQPCVCSSVRSFETSQCSVKTVERRIRQTTTYDRPGTRSGDWLIESRDVKINVKTGHLYSAFFVANVPLKRSEWHGLTRDHTVLPTTHEWNEPSCL